MVVAGEEDVALEKLEVVVEGLYAFEVEVVRGRVEDEAVGVLELHTCYHAAHLLTTREDVDLLQHFFSREEHPAEECLEIDFVAFSVLAEPIDKVEFALEELSIVERQICCCDGDAPVEGAGLCLAVAVDDFEERCHSPWVAAEEDHFVAFLYGEADVVEEHGAIVADGFQSFHFEDLVAGLSVHLEDDARVLACGRLDFLDVEFLEHLLAAGGLLALCHIG